MATFFVGLTESVEAKISTLEDSDDFEDFQSENEDWESVDEYCSVATQTVFPEMKTVTQYEEEEDWDKEMADSENNKNSYGKGRFIYDFFFKHKLGNLMTGKNI